MIFCIAEHFFFYLVFRINSHFINILEGSEIYETSLRFRNFDFFEMYSERFDPAPSPSRENSACYPYASPSNRQIARQLFVTRIPALLTSMLTSPTSLLTRRPSSCTASLTNSFFYSWLLNPHRTTLFSVPQGPGVPLRFF